jgi:plastocyanin
MKRFGSVVMLAAILSLAATACSSSSGSGSSGGSTTPPPASPSASPTAQESSGGGGGTTATVKAGAGGFVFDPTTVSIASGGTLTVQNVGTIAHTFTVQDKGINEVMAAGDSAEITVDLPPGTYPFVCTFHQSSGMKGTLTVT